MTEARAVEHIVKNGLRPRVVAREGQHFIVTMDYRLDRVNLAIAGGRVASARIG